MTPAARVALNGNRDGTKRLLDGCGTVPGIVLAAEVVEEHATGKSRWEVLACVFNACPVECDAKSQRLGRLYAVVRDKDNFTLLGGS